MKYRDTMFAQLYNLKDEHSTGRAMILISQLLGSIGSIFITGTFYTAFLMESGIDIVQVSILAFIPNICWLFGLFSPKVFAKIKKRRGILLFTHIFYYICMVLLPTMIPTFIADPDQRTVCFAVLLVAANVVNSIFGSGASAWHIRFLPEDDTRRSYHFSILYMVYNVVGTVTAVGAALATDAMADSGAQGTIITVLRYISFVLFVINGLQLYLVPKEYPYERSTGNTVRLTDVLTIPLRNKKYLLTILIVFLWNGVGGLTGGFWSYYLLDTIRIPYIMTYITSIVSCIVSLFFMRYWRRAIRHFGWIKVMWFNFLLTALAAALDIFLTPGTVWIVPIAATISGINLCGAQLTTDNLFYLNMPRNVDTDVYMTFGNAMVYIFVFLGNALGTWLLALLERPDGSPYAFLGLDFYAPQIITAIKVVCFIGTLIYIWKVAPKLETVKR